MEHQFLFYIQPENVTKPVVCFDPDESRHIQKVLRKSPGETVEATDGQGHLYQIRLNGTRGNQICGEVFHCHKSRAEPQRVLAMGLLRQRDRLEFAVEKSVELGATRLILVHSAHAVRTKVRSERIDKVILAAVKQSRRLWLPSWEEVEGFETAIGICRQLGPVYLADPEGTPANAVSMSTESACSLLIGPEGGFSASELMYARNCGVIHVALGRRRLRSETAMCCMMSLAMPVTR